MSRTLYEFKVLVKMIIELNIVNQSIYSFRMNDPNLQWQTRMQSLTVAFLFKFKFWFIFRLWFDRSLDLKGKTL